MQKKERKKEKEKKNVQLERISIKAIYFGS